MWIIAGSVRHACVSANGNCFENVFMSVQRTLQEKVLCADGSAELVLTQICARHEFLNVSPVTLLIRIISRSGALSTPAAGSSYICYRMAECTRMMLPDSRADRLSRLVSVWLPTPAIQPHCDTI